MTHLSLRLETIASLVPSGARVCDVGTDHALLPIYLKQSGSAKSVIATDLNKKPLENARRNIEESGVCDLSLRLCDGLSAVMPSEADTIIVAGMGGEVITGILGSCEWIKSADITLILQPTTSAEILREYLLDNGFEIENETPVYDNKKLYSVMLVRFKNNVIKPDPSVYYIGKIEPAGDGILYIEKQQKRVFDCMKALQNIESEQDKFLFYKSINDRLLKILTESNNGI